MNLKNFSIILLCGIFSTLLIVGCSSSQKQFDNEKNKINEFKNAPIWIKSNHINGSISELGVAKNSYENFTQQKNAAIANANENLSKKLNIKVSEIFKLINENNTSNEKYIDKIDIAREYIVTNGIKQSKTIKLWQSTSNTIYVLVSTNTQKIKKDFKETLKSSFKETDPINSNYELHLEKGDIDIILSKK